MARIRSIHPGLWTDDAFMALSAHARLLVIGLWTEAFDDGVFEWKPLTLKARIFPADNIDLAALLDELVAGSFVRREEFAGRQIGLIRNFREFQRPKKPNTSAMMMAEWENYVGLPTRGDEPVTDRSATDSENPPQMEDGGGRVEEKDGETRPSLSEPGAGARDIFDEVWQVFPRNPQSAVGPAHKAFTAISSAEHGGILAAAQRYARWFSEDSVRRKRTEFEGRDFVPKLSSWLASGAWREAASLPIKGESTGPVIAMIRLDRDRDAALWAECETQQGKKAATSDTNWAFRADVVEAARSSLAKRKAAAA